VTRSVCKRYYQLSVYFYDLLPNILHLQSSTANEIDQINLQINELLNQRKSLEEKWEKLESKDIQLQLISKFFLIPER
jgi:hypothetical protein